MAVSHVKSNTGADFTGTVTVHNSQASTTTIAATDLVRPGDWNSAHNFYQTLTGNTSNSSTMSGTNMVFGGTGAITLAASTAAGAGTVWVSAPPQSVLTYAGDVSLSSNGSTITISGSQKAASAANGSFTFQTLTFANSNGVSFSTGTQGLYASVNAAGGGATFSQYPYDIPGMWSSSMVSGTSGGTGGSTQHTVRGYLGPLILPAAHTYNDFEIYASYNTVAGTGSMSMGHMVGVYTLNGGTAFSLDRSYQWAAVMSQNSVTAQTWAQWWGTNSTSNSTGANGNISASYTGERQLILNNVGSSFSPGHYWLVHMYTARSSNSLLGQYASGFYSSPMASNSTFWTGGARPGTNTTQQPMGRGPFMGVFSTTTNNSNTGMPCLPASINTTAITQTGGSSQWRQLVPFFYS